MLIVCVSHCFSLQVGLRKLLDAEGEVNVMKQELIALQPKLIETGRCNPFMQVWTSSYCFRVAIASPAMCKESF